jgi:alpha-L-arabinofuranosidase
VIVKVVNFGNVPVDAAFNLRGAEIMATGKAIVLSGSPRDINTVDQPEKVSPKEELIADAGTTFHRVLAAHSLTLLRLTVKTR